MMSTTRIAISHNVEPRDRKLLNKTIEQYELVNELGYNQNIDILIKLFGSFV